MQTIPKISRFNQFPNGVAIGEVPLVFANQGKTFHVDSGTGTDALPGDSRRPFATIDYAIGQCTANNGDIILVSPGHSETVSSASAITLDVAGVTIIFLGHGGDKGTLTFNTATTASIVVSAASCAILGAKFVAGIDALANPIHVQAADFTLDCDWHDGSSTVEAARVVLTTAAADRLKATVRYHGFTAGNATVNVVRLVGVDDAEIYVDFYGVASTAVVEFLTTACTNIKIYGTVYNSGTTDGSKNVVDTATGSTWYSDIVDTTAGQRFTGGSGLAIASAGVLGGKDATTTDSINGKIGTDTEMADSSLFDMLAGGAGIASFPAASAAANNVSIAEVLRYISELQVPRVALKSTGSMASGFGTSDSPVTLFTVTGDCLVRMAASVDAAVTSTSSNGTLEVGVAGNTACLLVQDVADGTAFAIGDSWTLTTGADANGAQLADEWVLVGDGVDIVLTIATNDMTAGDIDFYCHYLPLTSGSSIVAA